MQKPAPLFTPVLIAGGVIMLVSFAIRSAFGVFQIPIAEEFGWLRSEFSLAIAIRDRRHWVRRDPCCRGPCEQ